MQEMKDSERGATAVEYGIIVALIAAVIIAVVRVVGGKTSNAIPQETGPRAGIRAGEGKRAGRPW
jgi:pilus assembly protein Flp/PilA